MDAGSFYKELIDKFKKLVADNNLLNEEIFITGRTLSVEEAIGRPKRRDYPIVKGKEQLMQSIFKGVKGQAFTDMAGDYHGTLKEILEINPENNFDRAVLIATMNAVMRYLGYIEDTIHCHDEKPEECAKQLVCYIKSEYDSPKVALIGLQPAMLENIAREFPVRVVDMDPDNVGQVKSGIIVEPIEVTDDVLKWCDLIVATGSTVVNCTITNYCNSKPALFFGTTGAAMTYLMGLKRFCPHSS